MFLKDFESTMDGFPITWRSRESQSQFLKCAFALCGLALQEVSDGLQTAYKKEMIWKKLEVS